MTSNKATFKVGDGLYGKLRPYLNKVTVADDFGYCSTEIVPISPQSRLAPEWLKLCLRRPCCLQYAEAKSYGMKMPRLGTKYAKASRHPVPPKAEQGWIIQRVEELMALYDQLEEAQAKQNSIRTAARRSAIDAVATASTSQELEVAWEGISSNWEVMAGQRS